MSTRPKIAVSTDGIGVEFGGVSVLRDISIDIEEAEIHGLIGENGAGKSTLGKVIGGYYAATRGIMTIFGQSIARWDPAIALENGVAMMHQELQLVPYLTVAQNVFLGIENERLGVLRRDEASRLDALMRKFGIGLDPDAVVASLPIADQQKIEVLRALARNARVIIMDEPTSSLSKDEVDQLHETMRMLRGEGRTVIYVSHFLDDILDVSDRLTILRDGEHVRTGTTGDEDKSTLVSAMLGGGKTETSYPVKVLPEPGDPILDVSSLASSTGVQDASFHISKGEIVGLVGLVGSGRSEIARAVIGADAATGGEVTIRGEPYERRTIAGSAAMGMVMVPEDRRHQGLVMTLPVRANMTLPHLAGYSTSGILKTVAERTRVRDLIDWFQVRPATVDGDILRYSGGNQQKVLFGKWLVGEPEIVILDEPSRGVDVGARERIHAAIAELAANGAAVLMISSEIEEVLGLAHRAYLIDRGRTVEEIDPGKNDESTVLSSLFKYQGSDVMEQVS